MNLIQRLTSWLVVIAILLLRASCRIRRHGDPRSRMRSESCRYAYSVLHAHQIAAIIDAEPGTGAMVSQSGDGGLIVPSLRACGVLPIRGSTSDQKQSKGGRAAFQELVEHVLHGSPAYFAVDGSRGPRNRVHLGVALLSKKTGASVLNLVAVPTRRWILARTWDRLQIPKPFSTIDVYFGEPILVREGESTDEYRGRIEMELNALELLHDPEEAALSFANTMQRAERRASRKTSPEEAELLEPPLALIDSDSHLEAQPNLPA